MTCFLLVRHGETDWNREGRFQGQSDAPLNPTGLSQAHDLAARLGSRSIEAVYASDLRRARATAEIIAGRKGLPVRLMPLLREIHQGSWEGHLVAEIRARYEGRDGGQEWDPVHSRAPGGESVAEVAARVRAAAETIAAVHPQETVLVVSHGLALAAFLCLVRSIALARAYDLIPGNGAIEEVMWAPDRPAGPGLTGA